MKSTQNSLSAFYWQFFLSAESYGNIWGISEIAGEMEQSAELIKKESKFVIFFL